VRPDTDSVTGGAAEYLKMLPELLTLACIRASFVARAQTLPSGLDCQEAASRRYRQPAI